MKNNLKKSFLANSFGTLVTVFDRLLVVPFLFFFLPPSVANTWIVIRTIPSYISSADIGMASEAGNRMTRAVFNNDFNLARRIYSSAFFCVTLFGGLIFIVFAIWTYFFGAYWIKKNLGYEILYSFGLLCFVALYSLQINQSQIINAVFRSAGIDYIGIFATHCIRIAEIILFCSAIYFAESVFFGAAAYFLARFVGNIVLNFYKRKKILWARVSIFNWEKKEAFSMVRPALGFAAFPLVMGLYQQLPISFLVAKFDATSAGNMSVLLIFCRFLSQYGMQMARTVWPELTRIAAAPGNEKKFWILHDKAVALVVFGGAGLCGVFFVFGEFFIKKWTLGNFEPKSSHLALALFTMYLNSIWMVSYASWQARSMHIIITKRFFWNFFFCIIGGLFLYQLNISNYLATTIMLVSCVVFESVMLFFVFSEAAKDRSVSIFEVFKNIYFSGVQFLSDKIKF